MTTTTTTMTTDTLPPDVLRLWETLRADTKFADRAATIAAAQHNAAEVSFQRGRESAFIAVTFTLLTLYPVLSDVLAQEGQ